MNYGYYSDDQGGSILLIIPVLCITVCSILVSVVVRFIVNHSIIYLIAVSFSTLQYLFMSTEYSL